LHNLPNKPLTGYSVLQDLENKGDSLQDLVNAGVMVGLELWETQAGGWWILSLPGFNYTRGVKGLAGRMVVGTHS
jgi:hypothetical protein